MLAFIHIPRTGGRKLFNILIKAFGEDAVGYFYPPAPGPISLPHKMYQRMFEHFGGVKCLSSNIVRPNQILEEQWENITYLTLLRHPIDRLCSSYISHFQRYGLHQHSLPYYLEDKLKTIDFYASQNENRNFMTRFFSESDWSARVSQKHLSIAQNAIERIHIVGTTESIAYPLRSLLRHYPKFQQQNLEPLFQGGKQYRQSISPIVLKKLISLNEYDIALYSYVMELNLRCANNQIKENVHN